MSSTIFLWVLEKILKLIENKVNPCVQQLSPGFPIKSGMTKGVFGNDKGLARNDE